MARPNSPRLSFAVVDLNSNDELPKNIERVRADDRWEYAPVDSLSLAREASASLGSSCLYVCSAVEVARDD